MKVEADLERLGIELAPKPVAEGSIVPCRQIGNVLYVSGHGPADNNGKLLYQGQVGKEVSLEDARKAARASGIQLLRSMKDFLGDLDRIEYVVKALGFVNSAPGFFDQPKVMNGFSDFMTEVFGADGLHARSAIGTSCLPQNQPVEIELIVALRP